MHDQVRCVSRHGMLHMGSRPPFYVSKALACEQVGMREIEPKVWLVSFMNFDIGWYIEEKNRFVTEM